MRVLITGGCGFMGHHLVEHIIKNTDWEIVVLDNFNYASSGMDRLRDINCLERTTILAANLLLSLSVGVKKEIGDIDYIFHLAAETHVDRSIKDPYPFIMNNIIGTYNILEYARKCKTLKKFFYFSTDEVFGPAPKGVKYKEWDRYNSGNPYAATKAGAEELCLAYCNTYKLPIVITHTMNLYGERQHPEKFIPMCIDKILKGETVTIHADKTKKISGSRFYIHCRNVASALLFLVEHGKIGDKYNIVGEKEISNLDLAQFIAQILHKKLKYRLTDFHSERPGHDLRYALSGDKLKQMGWKPPINFKVSLRNTVAWSLVHFKWLHS